MNLLKWFKPEPKRKFYLSSAEQIEASNVRWQQMMNERARLDAEWEQCKRDMKRQEQQEELELRLRALKGHWEIQRLRREVDELKARLHE